MKLRNPFKRKPSTEHPALVTVHCAGVTKAGAPCKRTTDAWSDAPATHLWYCVQHDPDWA